MVRQSCAEGGGAALPGTVVSVDSLIGWKRITSSQKACVCQEMRSMLITSASVRARTMFQSMLRALGRWYGCPDGLNCRALVVATSVRRPRCVGLYS